MANILRKYFLPLAVIVVLILFVTSFQQVEKEKHISKIYVRYFNWGIDKRVDFNNIDFFVKDRLNLYHYTITDKKTLNNMERHLRVYLKENNIISDKSRIEYDFRIFAQIYWTDNRTDTLLLDVWGYSLYNKDLYFTHPKIRKIFDKNKSYGEETLKLKYKN